VTTNRDAPKNESLDGMKETFSKMSASIINRDTDGKWSAVW